MAQQDHSCAQGPATQRADSGRTQRCSRGNWEALPKLVEKTAHDKHIPLLFTPSSLPLLPPHAVGMQPHRLVPHGFWWEERGLLDQDFLLTSEGRITLWSLLQQIPDILPFPMQQLKRRGQVSGGYISLSFWISICLHKHRNGRSAVCAIPSILRQLRQYEQCADQGSSPHLALVRSGGDVKCLY